MEMPSVYSVLGTFTPLFRQNITKYKAKHKDFPKPRYVEFDIFSDKDGNFFTGNLRPSNRKPLVSI